MNLLPSLLPLLLCLLAATMLGAGLGACAWHLRLVRRHDRALQQARRASAREREAVEALLARERELALAGRERQARRVGEGARTGRARPSRAATRSPRARASGRVTPRRSRRACTPSSDDCPGRDASGSTTSEVRRWSCATIRSGRERLPVLRRRVGGAASTFGDESFSLDAELVDEAIEIPTLPESALPDSIDELVSELLDTGAPDAGRDER